MHQRFWFAITGIVLAAQVLANPVLTEFMADNETTIQDENGDFSDWIEIHNPTLTELLLDGWYLTDTATNKTKWQFPAVTLQPGEFLIVWASSKNRRVTGAPLHTNFSLSKGGEFLALVRPNGTTVEQQFAPAYPAQVVDQSYGSRFTSNKLLAANATGRYKIPTNSTDPATNWNQPGFNDTSWTAGAGGFGFGITQPGITVKEISKNGTLSGLNDALALISFAPGNASIKTSTTKTYDLINFLGDDMDGDFAFNNVFPGGGGDHYAVVANGFVNIPVAGNYTFGIHSTGGGQILIDNVEIMRDDVFDGPRLRTGSVILSVGIHQFQALMFDKTANDCFEFVAAVSLPSNGGQGEFRLVGDVANGGLAASTTITGVGGLVGTDLKTAMGSSTSAFVRLEFPSTGAASATTASMVMRYNDGYAAWINGTAVAAKNAPTNPSWNSLSTAARTNSQTLAGQAFNLTSLLPTWGSGSNTIAVQGLRSAAEDPSFLLRPEIIIGNLDSTAAPAPYGGGLATPGWINGSPSSLGNVADTQFSIQRGFYTAPILVAITSTTPGAVIRYTTDGSAPTATNGIIYTAPLNLAKTTVLRARASLVNWLPTNVDTQTYLFPNDIITQSANGAAPPGWPASIPPTIPPDYDGPQIYNYGMDPKIVNNTNLDIGGNASVKAALLALPSISVTTGLANLFDSIGSRGIYSNAEERGFAWERPASIEWINPPDATHPNGTGEFQIDAGIRIRGGFSRSNYNPKHSWRFFFREEYGSPKLRYPVFGRDAAQTFDKLDMRTGQNFSWAFTGESSTTFLKEESCRQASIDMGQPGSHVRYAHYYLNGQYWGLYTFEERTEASFSETYLGGDKDEYDVVKTQRAFNYTTGATDGNLDAWQSLWSLGKVHRANPSNANYFKMMGLAADGSTTTVDPVLLDADNLIDYLLLTFWTGNLDGCTSFFFGENKANNLFASRRRVGNLRQGFKYYVHDFEWTMVSVNEDRTGPFVRENEGKFEYANPMFLHQDLVGNAEYRMRWADRVHRHLFDDGKLTGSAWQNRINKLAAFVEPAIIAESARWGDAQRADPFTKRNWLIAQSQLLTTLPPRTDVVIAQLRADKLYPLIDAPTLRPYGGHQPDGIQILINGPTGATNYYMADGSDPRAIGGALRPGALTSGTNSTEEVLIPLSADNWKYQGNGINLGSAWRVAGFNDSSWSTGTAELGYGDGDEATVIPIVDIDSNRIGIQKPAACYFRKSFTLSNIGQVANLRMNVEYDDAFAVYLNGTRVGGDLPIDPAYNFYSPVPIEDTIASITIPTSLLVNGVNTICVEVHQASEISDDLSMNLSLTANRTQATTPLLLTGTGEHTLRVRSLSGTTWSALSESVYQIGTALPAVGDLIISEISCAPLAPHIAAEFIELYNTSATVMLDLGGSRFTEGIDYTFPSNTNLPPGGRLLIVKNIAAFELLHGSGKPIAGIFQNNTGLSKTGERLRLETAEGVVLLDFTYFTGFPWPTVAGGRSLILTDINRPEDSRAWRSSAALIGNPGTSDELVRAPGQSLLDYALGGTAPSFDVTTGIFSVSRRLGADAVSLQPEWSTDLRQWSRGALGLVAETMGSGATSTLSWQLAPLPAGKAFIRLNFAEKP
jgi:hypothetical protein